MRRTLLYIFCSPRRARSRPHRHAPLRLARPQLLLAEATQTARRTCHKNAEPRRQVRDARARSRAEQHANELLRIVL